MCQRRKEEEKEREKKRESGRRRAEKIYSGDQKKTAHSRKIQFFSSHRVFTCFLQSRDSTYLFGYTYSLLRSTPMDPVQNSQPQLVQLTRLTLSHGITAAYLFENLSKLLYLNSLLIHKQNMKTKKTSFFQSIINTISNGLVVAIRKYTSILPSRNHRQPGETGIPWTQGSLPDLHRIRGPRIPLHQSSSEPPARK